MTKKVCFIICYYGPFPQWMDLFIQSCASNPRFDFMLVTDNELPGRPENVSILPLSFEELRERFSRLLGFPAALTKAYKLCDYRPLYGRAFQEELRGYDFWGHCDVDQIWGDLEDFIDDTLLDAWPRIGLYGHCTLYRNTEEINRLSLRPGAAFPYDRVCSDKAHYGFNDITGSNLIFEKQGVPYYKALPIGDANWLLPRVSVYPCRSGKEFYCWQDGKILRVYEQNGLRTQEFAYLHFQKKTPFYDPRLDYSRGFYIKTDRFVPREPGPFTLEELERENEFKSALCDFTGILRGEAKRARQFLLKKNLHEKRILLGKGSAYAGYRLRSLLRGESKKP